MDEIRVLDSIIFGAIIGFITWFPKFRLIYELLIYSGMRPSHWLSVEEFLELNYEGNVRVTDGIIMTFAKYDKNGFHDNGNCTLHQIKTITKVKLIL